MAKKMMKNLLKADKKSAEFASVNLSLRNLKMN
jgi:hypothetical protein